MNNKNYFPLTDIENILPILDKIAIFGGLSEKQLFNVFKVLKKVSYDEGELIFKRGDPPSQVYIIKKGRVKLYVEAEGTKLELVEFGVGSCFGESSFIGIEAHTADAIAIENTELIVLTGQGLLTLYNQDKEAYVMILLNIARETSRRLHQADNTLLHYYLTQANNNRVNKK